MANCIFCKILAGEAPVSMVYEDKLCAAFMDIQPVNAGHVLVVPKVHIAYWKDMDEDLGGHLFKIGIRIDKALRKTELRCEGVNFFAADGKAAFQEVFHAHLHVFPRYKGDGFRLKFGENYRNLPSRQNLNEIALKIKLQLD